MKHLIKFVAIFLALFYLQSCNSMTDKDRKLIAESVAGIIGISNICLSEPLQHNFDPNKPDEIEVKVTLSNSNNYDVVSSGSLSIQVFMREINSPYNIVGESYQGYQIPRLDINGVPIIFPKNSAKAYTTPFIKVNSYRTLKKGEQYKIEVRKDFSGITYPDNFPLYKNSCYLYNYTITL